jgi:hypothetical protein
MIRPRLFTFVVLTMAMTIASTVSEATSKRIQVTSEVVQTTFTGNPTSPQLGDQHITNVDLFDESHLRVGTGVGSCTIVSIPPLDIFEQCLLTAVFAEGHIIFGGVAPLVAVGVTARFGILGGTDAFRKARGEVTIVVTSPEFMDVTFELHQPVLP